VGLSNLPLCYESIAEARRMDSQQLPDRRRAPDVRRKNAKRARPSHASLSDPGCEREGNEDRCLVSESPSGVGYFVFDGVAGERGGDVAAQLALEAVEQHLCEAPEGDDAQAILRGALELAHKKILEVQGAQSLKGMGTTACAALLRDSEVVIAHVGDSRAYLISDGEIQQVTCDHTLVQQLVEAGKIAAEDALIHPQSHILTRCLGSEFDSAIDSAKFWIWPCESQSASDTLVLCTDGLYSLVTDQQLCEIVSQLEPNEAVQYLIHLARERGGFDNITAVVIRLGGVLKTEPPVPELAEGLAILEDEDPPTLFHESLSVDRHSEARTEASPGRLRTMLVNALVLVGIAVCVAALTFGTLLVLQR
jgi:serine/threonine protein phosphatase PrpC